MLPYISVCKGVIHRYQRKNHLNGLLKQCRAKFSYKEAEVQKVEEAQCPWELTEMLEKCLDFHKREFPKWEWAAVSSCDLKGHKPSS